jgi:TonB family protein
MEDMGQRPPDDSPRTSVPARPDTRPLAWRIALTASLGLHLVGIGISAWAIFYGSARPNGGSEDGLIEVAVESSDAPRHPPVASEGLERSEPVRVAETARPNRGASAGEPRPDTGRPGRGGTSTARMKAVNLSDTIDEVTLARDVFDSLASGQLARTKSGALRRSLDDRASAPQPTELEFVSNSDQRFVASSERPESLWARRGQSNERPTTVDDGSFEQGAARSMLPAPGGSETPEREVVRLRAAVTMARPWINPGRASVASPKPGSPADSVSSTQRVASLVQSLVHASSAGGRLGEGSGGQQEPGPQGSGGLAGPGSVSAAHGNGAGLGTGEDIGTLPYFREMQKKLERYSRDAFPRWAIARGLGGLATIGLIVLRDGRVAEAHVVRPSGIPEYDQNVLEAVRRAAPYGPLPSALAARPLAMQMSFDATNPAVGRDGPGPGQRRP